MAKISTYAVDTNLTGNEKLLGSADTTLDTVNVTVSGIANYTWNNPNKVANQAARLALTPQVGWIVFQQDTQELYIYKTAGWVKIV
jgi:hypothetical protein